jgi:iron complex transport system substrate-binding protein
MNGKGIVTLAAIAAAGTLWLVWAGEQHVVAVPAASFTDDCGRRVEVRAYPRTIVSLAPSVTQMLIALDKADMLLAVTQWCEGAGLEEKARIGSLTTPDMERIIALGPDIVIGTEMTPMHVYESLEASGIACAVFKHQDLSDVMEDMHKICAILGQEEEGRKVLDAMAARRDAILSRIPAGSAVKVALLYDLESMGSAGKGSWVDDMFTSIGLDNIANRAQSAWPRLSFEALISEQPRWIILPMPSDAGMAAAMNAQIGAMKGDSVWMRVDAAREGRLLIVPEILLNVPGPRTLDAMDKLSRAIHGAK